MKTLLFTGISVKNCMQLYAIEKPQITADKIRAFVSLSWEERTERSRPGLTKQRHVVRSRALSLLHLLSPWLPRTRPLGSKAAAEAPALVFMSHATGELKGTSPSWGTCLRPPFRKSTGHFHFLSHVTRPHLAAREMFSLPISACPVKPGILPGRSEGIDVGMGSQHSLLWWGYILRALKTALWDGGSDLGSDLRL